MLLRLSVYLVMYLFWVQASCKLIKKAGGEGVAGDGSFSVKRQISSAILHTQPTAFVTKAAGNVGRFVHISFIPLLFHPVKGKVHTCYKIVMYSD